MVYKSCPECKESVPVATKYCACGYIFFHKRLLHPKPVQSGKIAIDHMVGLNRRRTGRIIRGRPAYYTASEFENPFKKYSTSKSAGKTPRSKSTGDDPSPTGKHKKKRGRPPGLSKKKELKEKVPKIEKPESSEFDMYKHNSPEKNFIFAVTLSDINRKLGNEWNGPRVVGDNTPSSSTTSR